MGVLCFCRASSFARIIYQFWFFCLLLEFFVCGNILLGPFVRFYGCNFLIENKVTFSRLFLFYCRYCVWFGSWILGGVYLVLWACVVLSSSFLCLWGMRGMGILGTFKKRQQLLGNNNSSLLNPLCLLRVGMKTLISSVSFVEYFYFLFITFRRSSFIAVVIRASFYWCICEFGMVCEYGLLFLCNFAFFSSTI